ncbi:2OG-Fe(II) oxygenase family protein [Shewanella submarina]|uniref:TIGR02466 family protein n=1 Tax=Shewanella submarina TaxID=2016376 RepID=A0ABV7GJS9_9GAMM|nr:TIGR02466 family protein [Shewanella submarina]MCL1036213.1 2OG-Fe(II) oxygenase family protein [Shewanella submarina]
MKIDLWFATPVYHHDANEAEAGMIQSSVAQMLDTEYKEILSRDDAKSRSYIQSRHLEHRQVLHKYQLDELHHWLTQHCGGFIKKLHPDAKALEIRESWLNFYFPGDSQEVHHHMHPTSPSFISGSLYLEAEPESGDIKFYHPAFGASGYQSSQGLETFEASYAPKPNRLVLFRSHVPHGVMQNRSDKVRISLSFNVYIQD